MVQNKRPTYFIGKFEDLFDLYHERLKATPERQREFYREAIGMIED